MKEDISPIDKNLLHKDLSVYDLVYNKERETRLIKDAEYLRLPAAGGLRMLFHQGVRAFEFWTGKEAPVDAMWKALEEAVKK